MATFRLLVESRIQWLLKTEWTELNKVGIRNQLNSMYL